jgi:hypothetical protein
MRTVAPGAWKARSRRTRPATTSDVQPFGRPDLDGLQVRWLRPVRAEDAWTTTAMVFKRLASAPENDLRRAYFGSAVVVASKAASALGLNLASELGSGEAVPALAAVLSESEEYRALLQVDRAGSGAPEGRAGAVTGSEPVLVVAPQAVALPADLFEATGPAGRRFGGDSDIEPVLGGLLASSVSLRYGEVIWLCRAGGETLTVPGTVDAPIAAFASSFFSAK